MEIAYNWLSAYLPQPIAIDELSNILTAIGLEVEAIEKVEAVPGGLEGLVIGEVLTCVPHPDADKLKITTVQVGNNAILPIVCGAPNVAAGQKVVVATVNTTVHPTNGEAFKIKKAKIRGEASEGMICAEDEIGLGTSHEGIMVLANDAVPGTPAKNYFNIAATDYTISIGLTPNRSDGNSHLGVARDVCAYLSHHGGQPARVVMPNVELPPVGTLQLPFDIAVEDEQACPRYAAITIAGVNTGASPEWLVQRLKAIGLRSINNVVDITNYVLHEYGQPLHAFDYDTIGQHRIIVRKACEDETFTALDGKERKLRAEDLLITDSGKALCMAGVFGGATSGVTNDTKNIFLESAYFHPRTIRRTSMHHGLRTDAATHFEKGVDIAMVIPALQRAAQLIADLAGGTIASEITDHYPHPLAAKEIEVQYRYIQNLCGKKYAPEAIDEILTALGFGICNKTADYLAVKVPSNKTDVLQPADIAEEILRIDGLDNVAIPTRLHMALQRYPNPPSRKYKEQIAEALTGAGLQEIVTNSITNSKYYAEDAPLVRMVNNLSSELDVMRPQMLESGLEVVAYNVNRKSQDLKLYEIGNIYQQTAVGKYVQQSKLAIWVTGNIAAQHWQQQAQKANLYYVKGLVNGLLDLCGIKKLQEQTDGGAIVWKRGKTELATAYTLTAEKLKRFDIKQEVFYAEIDIAAFTDAAANNKVRYSELPKYPSVRRDLALVLDKNVPYAKVAGIAQAQKWEALKNYDLFDIFESDKLGKDKKSLALSFTFQLNDRTLTDEEVDAMMQQLIGQYKNELQAIVRD
ncbi:MAG: phenylalanine--tRNA ligase subunit beta [Edaphocola sp.]